MKELKPLSTTAPVASITTDAPDDIPRLKTILTRINRLRHILRELKQQGFHLLPNSRRLKIQPVYRPTLGDPYGTVPSITLSGVWLEKNGFNSSGHIRIIPFNGLIIICKDDNQQQTQQQAD